MGSLAIQAKLWGQKPKDWSEIQEKTGRQGYEFVLNHLSPASGSKLLDVGCGSGLFVKLAFEKGMDVTGMDATPELITEAKKRVPGVKFLVGEMEELAFEDQSFDVVCGFNSFQFASDMPNAIAEAKRVLKAGGKIAVVIWGNKEDCEAATYLKAIGNLLPPPPPGAGGPFALSENQLLEKILRDAGFKILHYEDVSFIWDYDDTDTALRGLLSTGPAAKAIESRGFETVYETILKAVQPYIQVNEHVVYHNKFRVVIAEK